MAKIAIIQFPGSNTERETFMACERTGLTPVEFLWNEPVQELSKFHGYILVGGFSYEDRSRAGVIASLEPIIDKLKLESESGKPILGICNGAQILIESGMVPGLRNYQVGAALTDNKRIQNNQIVGVGYYNTWANLKMGVEPNRCAFTRHMKKDDWMNIPLAHGEGRFVLPKPLLKEMIDSQQTVYRYCDNDGNVIDEFPTNPNGSDYSLAGVCNPQGNVMAIMPHPERTPNGDAIFSSMLEYVNEGNPRTNHQLSSKKVPLEINDYKNNNNTEWIIDMIINDNEASSVQNALTQKGYDVLLSRQTHWEIEIDENIDEILTKIDTTGELYNSNKEYLSEIKSNENTVSFLIRQKEDIHGRAKYESLTEKFGISEILNIKHGVIWNVIVNSGNFESTINSILETNILFNTLSYECYRIK
ncbi:MAG: phosphoribosylformylglycinamidine synthase I [Candidatus Neomarinimicrobiota bacterium]|nr:phosphoribosylformylglycinamidine synthase I [Candidatus Neomarinimicrobiota bacterium]